MKDKKCTIISKDALQKDGYKPVNAEQTIFKKGKNYITFSIRWQICDEDGYVGNEYIDTMEELHDREK